MVSKSTGKKLYVVSKTIFPYLIDIEKINIMAKSRSQAKSIYAKRTGSDFSDLRTKLKKEDEDFR